MIRKLLNLRIKYLNLIETVRCLLKILSCKWLRIEDALKGKIYYDKFEMVSKARGSNFSSDDSVFNSIYTEVIFACLHCKGD